MFFESPLKVVRISNRYRWFRRYGTDLVPPRGRTSFPPAASERISLNPLSYYPSALRRALLDFRLKIREYGALFSRVFSGIRQGVKFRPPRRPTRFGQLIRNRRKLFLFFKLPPSYFRRYSRKFNRRGLQSSPLRLRGRTELRQDLLLMRLGFGDSPARTRLMCQLHPLLFDGGIPLRWDSSAGPGVYITLNPESSISSLRVVHGFLHRLRRNFSYLRFPAYMESDRSSICFLIYRTPEISDSIFPFFFRPYFFFSLR